jgi:hypothetical protein
MLFMKAFCCVAAIPSKCKGKHRESNLSQLYETRIYPTTLNREEFNFAHVGDKSTGLSNNNNNMQFAALRSFYVGLIKTTTLSTYSEGGTYHVHICIF